MIGIKTPPLFLQGWGGSPRVASLGSGWNEGREVLKAIQISLNNLPHNMWPSEEDFTVDENAPIEILVAMDPSHGHLNFTFMNADVYEIHVDTDHGDEILLIKTPDFANVTEANLFQALRQISDNVVRQYVPAMSLRIISIHDYQGVERFPVDWFFKRQQE